MPPLWLPRCLPEGSYFSEVKVTAKQMARSAAHRRIWEEAGVEYGLCLCGCGARTGLASRTLAPACQVKGEPLRYLFNHHARGPRGTKHDLNPAGICWCGCGQTTSTYFLSRRGRSPVHARYVVGHHARKSPVDYVEEDRGFESPCWVWQRKITGKGYGIVRLAGGREQQAHRWVWEREVGPLSADVELHHRCEVTACVRPSHCEPLSKEAHLALHWEARHAAR